MDLDPLLIRKRDRERKGFPWFDSAITSCRTPLPTELDSYYLV